MPPRMIVTNTGSFTMHVEVNWHVASVSLIHRWLRLTYSSEVTNAACRKSKLIIHQADCDRDTACGHVFRDKLGRDNILLLCSISITNIFSLLKYEIFEIRFNKAKMRGIAITERRYSQFDIQHYEQKRLSNSLLILPEKNAGALWKVISRQSKDPKQIVISELWIFLAAKSPRLIQMKWLLGFH